MSYAYDAIRRALKDGYPWKIKGNGEYTAYLVDIQPLIGHEYSGIYRYPGGCVVHDLGSIRAYMEVLQQLPPEYQREEE